MFVRFQLPHEVLRPCVEHEIVVEVHVSYHLNSSKGVIYGIMYGNILGLVEGDTRSLDYSSCYELRRGCCVELPLHTLVVGDGGKLLYDLTYVVLPEFVVFRN